MFLSMPVCFGCVVNWVFAAAAGCRVLLAALFCAFSLPSGFGKELASATRG
jgi:hypothetical protein